MCSFKRLMVLVDPEEMPLAGGWWWMLVAGTCGGAMQHSAGGLNDTRGARQVCCKQAAGDGRQTSQLYHRHRPHANVSWVCKYYFQQHTYNSHGFCTQENIPPHGDVQGRAGLNVFTPALNGGAQAWNCSNALEAAALKLGAGQGLESQQLPQLVGVVWRAFLELVLQPVASMHASCQSPLHNMPLLRCPFNCGKKQCWMPMAARARRGLGGLLRDCVRCSLCW
jgi:hypothetical protein